MRLILILLFSSISFVAFSQKEITWDKNKPLEWNDYKGKPNKLSSFRALTASSIGINIKYENDMVTIIVENTFVPKDSWTKETKEGNLLNHERLHFDISELFARKFRKMLIENEFKTSGNKLMNEITDLYEEIMRELDLYQREYDKQTNHSIRIAEQKEWEARVSKALTELEDYTEPIVTFEVK